MLFEYIISLYALGKEVPTKKIIINKLLKIMISLKTMRFCYKKKKKIITQKKEKTKTKLHDKIHFFNPKVTII